MTPEDARAYLGLGTDVISDAALGVCIKYAVEWCDDKAQSYGGAKVPEPAIMLMTEYFVRQNLDLRGIKPSSISMPGMTMSTDLNATQARLEEQATQAIKAAAVGNGKAFRHIRSGKVAPWH